VRIPKEIRDINFSALGPLLHTKAKAIDKNYSVRALSSIYYYYYSLSFFLLFFLSAGDG
jgi:hypothetical protein